MPAIARRRQRGAQTNLSLHGAQLLFTRKQTIGNRMIAQCPRTQPMDDSKLLAFMRSHRWAIEATSTLSGAPQAAIIGIAVTNELEIVFDTLSSSRKAANLRANPRIALVVGGWDDLDARTVQYEGEIDFPAEPELSHLKQIYFSTFSDGPTRDAWPGTTYVRVSPLWIRLSDFTVDPPAISERFFTKK